MISYSVNSAYNSRNNIGFSGLTKAFAVSDSHLRSQEKMRLLERIVQQAKQVGNVLLLDCGDALCKGPWPADLEIDTYIKAKQLAPQLKIVFNVGNNDYKDIKNFQKLVKTFTENDIPVVSMNAWKTFETVGVKGVKPYTIVESDGDRLLVAGFTMKDPKSIISITADPVQSIQTLKEAIAKEKPDGVVVLNHDFYEKNKELVALAKQEGIKIDLFIGGHEHKNYSDRINRIYHPQGFNKSMYEFDLKIQDRVSEIKSKYRLGLRKITTPEFRDALNNTAKANNFYDEIVKARVIMSGERNAVVSSPTAFGTFIADSLKDCSKADAAFFCDRFIEGDLTHKKGVVTLFDVHKAFPPGPSRVQVVQLSASQLKDVFENSLKKQNKGAANKAFLQYSSNLKLVRSVESDAEADKLLNSRVKQIYINGEPLFDEKTGLPLDFDKKFACAIDSYIGTGKQNYDVLKSIFKKDVLDNGKTVSLQDALFSALKKIPQNTKELFSYFPAEMQNTEKL